MPNVISEDRTRLTDERSGGEPVVPIEARRSVA
jgi:hypothetical protein